MAQTKARVKKSEKVDQHWLIFRSSSKLVTELHVLCAFVSIQIFKKKYFSPVLYVFLQFTR